MKGLSFAEYRRAFKESKIRKKLLRLFTFMGTVFETLGIWFFTVFILSCITEYVARYSSDYDNKYVGTFLWLGVVFVVMLLAVYSLLENFKVARRIFKMDGDELESKSITLGLSVLIVIALAVACVLISLI